MFTTFMILLSIAIAALGFMAYVGIYHYSENTEDEDADKTTSDLKKIFAGLLFVIIVSLGIMAFSHYTEKTTDVQSIQVEAK